MAWGGRYMSYSFEEVLEINTKRYLPYEGRSKAEDMHKIRQALKTILQENQRAKKRQQEDRAWKNRLLKELVAMKKENEDYKRKFLALERKVNNVNRRLDITFCERSFGTEDIIRRAKDVDELYFKEKHFKKRFKPVRNVDAVVDVDNPNLCSICHKDINRCQEDNAEADGADYENVRCYSEPTVSFDKSKKPNFISLETYVI